jgi:Predicted acetyltransferase
MFKTTYERAREFISKQPDKCLNLSGKLLVGEAECFTDDAFSGLLIKNSYEVSVYTENEAFADEVFSFLGKGYFEFSCVEDSVAELLLRSKKPMWSTHCRIMKYPHDTVPKVKIPDGITVAPIDLKFMNIIDRNYTFRSKDSKARLQAEIIARPSAAVYQENGDISAWTLLHEDYALGVMFVLPKYRRRGYAALATVNLMQKVLDKGFTPYVQILDDNDASIALATSLGFQTICFSNWFGIRLK